MARIRGRLTINPLERRELPSVSATGGNFLVNTVTTGTQAAPAVAMDADNEMVIAWQDNSQEGSGGYGIFAQRYVNLIKVGPSFHVNDFTTGSQVNPDVAMDAAGDSVIVWQSTGQDGWGTAVYGQRYDSAGNRQGAQFRANTFTIDNQGVPSVAMDAVGNFVVVWQSFNQDGSAWGVFGQRYNAAGSPQGPEFHVSNSILNSQFEPAVAMDDVGNFAVTWTDDALDGSGYGVYARRFNAAGVAQGNEFRVNALTTSDQGSPDIAMDADGDFVIVWQTYAVPTAQIVARKFSSSGAAITGESSVLSGSHIFSHPAIARSARDGTDGVSRGFAVSGIDEGTSTIPPHVEVRYNPQDGSPNTVVTVNTYVTGPRTATALAMSSSGDFVVAWQGEGTGDSAGVFAQSYNDSTDLACPIVTGVTTPLDDAPLPENGRLLSPITSMTVSFSESITNSTLLTNWGLARDGVPMANPISSISFSFNLSTRRYEATLSLSAPLLDRHTYTLTAGANLQDAAGNLIDGNYDGIAGGEFTRTFNIVAPLKLGSEFRVNTTDGPTGNTSQGVATAADAAGEMVVVWSRSSGSNFGVYAQVYTAAGAPRGQEILVTADGRDDGLDVAMDPAGNFVVCYQRFNVTGGNLEDVFARRYALNGVPSGGEFRVNQSTTGYQLASAVSMDAAGDMIFVWQNDPSSVPSAYDIYCRRFYPDHTPIDNEFRVNSYTTGHQTGPSVAADAAGDIIVAWQNYDSSAPLQSFYRGVFAADDTPIGGQPAHIGEAPAVAMDAAGNYVFAWKEMNSNFLYEIAFQRYSLLGTALGGEIASPANATGDQIQPRISMDAAGDLVVVWAGFDSEGTGNGYGVFATRISGDHGLADPFFDHVNTITVGNQWVPDVAMDGDGDYIIAWDSVPNGGNAVVKAQRYGVAPPAVQSVQINDGSVQRSRVASVTLSFHAVVNFAGNPTDAFTLSRVGDSAPVVFTATANNNSGATVVTLGNFSGPASDNGSLADGKYTLHVLQSQVFNLGGLLDGDGDFIGGDDYELIGMAANGLFRLFGDADGNGTVNSADFAAFRTAFGLGASIFDFNNDGQTNSNDFAEFRKRFGLTI